VALYRFTVAMQARTFKQGALGNSFRKAPLSSSIQVIFEAFPEIEQFGNFVSTQVAAMTTSEPSDGAEARERQQIEVYRSKAAWEVRKFCNKYSAKLIEPTSSELTDVSAACAEFPPAAVTAGIYDQLASWGFGGDLDWQPRLRALCLLEYMLSQPGLAHQAASAAVDDLRQLLQFMSAEVPQCKGVACRLLTEGVVFDVDAKFHAGHVPSDRRMPQFNECKQRPIDCPEDLESLPSTDDDFDVVLSSDTESEHFLAL